MNYFLALLLCAYSLAGVCFAAETAPTRTVPYKTVGETVLNVDVFEPPGHKATDQSPAIVFFFGGGWVGGSPKQFHQQAKILSQRGMVAFCADYRVGNRHKTTPLECVQDGKSAIRWIRAHAAELGVDPNRIVAAGGSAGGHVAACTGIFETAQETGEDVSIRSMPNALILFNPVLDTTAKGYGSQKFTTEQQTELSPCHHVRRGVAPTLIFHGTADSTVPFENAERFTKRMREEGNVCELVAFEGKDHGFFNGSLFRKGNTDVDFNKTMACSVEFLKAKGILK